MNFAAARIMECRARIDALLVRVEGMKALNAMRQDQGLAQAYAEEAFIKVSEEIDGIGNLMHELAEKVE
jgi:hypothetical protein